MFSVWYQQKLIKAMYALAFFAALRVGEITGGPGQQTKNVITIDQFFFPRDELNNIVAAKLVLKHYFTENDNTFEFLRDVSTETSVIFS